MAGAEVARGEEARRKGLSTRGVAGFWPAPGQAEGIAARRVAASRLPFFFAESLLLLPPLGQTNPTDFLSRSFFVGFPQNQNGATIQRWTGCGLDRKGEEPMHDLLIALAFIGMVIAPAVVAAKSGSGEPVEDSE